MTTTVKDKPASGWISVKEQLPKKYVLVNVVLYGKVTAGWVRDQSGPDPGFKWNICSESSYLTNNVTHWMPLPEPPRKETL